MAPKISYSELQNQNYWPWGHKTSQKGKELLNFTDLTGFRSLSTIIWKIWTCFGERRVKNAKSQFSGILRKVEITQVQNDLKS